MAFFKKLKDRLFKSSSKIDEGLEAIVSDGGEAEADVLPVDEVMDAPAQAVEEMPEAVEPDPAEEARLREEREAAEQAARQVEEKRKADEQRRAAEAKAAAQAVEDARAKADAAKQAQVAAEAAEEDERRKAAEAAQAAQAAAEAAQAEQDRQAREEAARLAAEEALAAKRAEEEASKRAEEEAARQAEAAAAEKEAETLRTTLTPVAPILSEAAPESAAPKRGILGRLMGRGSDAAPVVRRVLDDAMLEQLEELLIASDMGVDTALRVTANMAEGRLGKKLSVQEIKALMSSEIARIMEPVAKPLPLYAKAPQVVLVVGVNGSGKTTTIGKLASQFRAAGKKVVIAAGDTFRAAAVEQLQVWGERAGVPVLTAPQGSDPASLAFDAMGRAEADGADLLLIDTAGRLQNRGDLMEELAKIVRVIRKKDPDAPHNTLLVLDATTGQNALNQVKVFQEISDVSGLVMTKLDGTAKGGVLVALADKFGLPIHAIGVGEQIDDLQPFDPQEFADALTGLDR
ncbi:signal recognition particle-docking protein FtsY [Sulfitobacter sp. S223]|uniref:signal recognition particle-docking protein FtsY n=1 Tax=Sulfitobacter sp. S223 TaxID=2867023 RepID=UPI0021A3A667|nr:signal recognition particle-docking protein FtsY [Sulfitobacter sp. S223]UWR25332.1 signal recognition particle-docking protein FtsY [Sulfitobacter sp. S223]